MAEQKECEMSKMLSKQLNLECSSLYNYLKLETICLQSDRNFCGLAEFFRKQKREEGEHALGVRQFMVRRNMKINWAPIQDSIDDNVKCPKAMLKMALENEMRENENLNATNKKATELGEYSVCSFLQPYLDEQLNSMNKLERLLGKLEHIKDPAGMMIFDVLLSDYMEKKCREKHEQKK